MMSLGLVKDLASIEVTDTAGRPIRLDTLWQDQTRVIALVRHFG